MKCTLLSLIGEIQLQGIIHVWRRGNILYRKQKCGLILMMKKQKYFHKNLKLLKMHIFSFLKELTCLVQLSYIFLFEKEQIQVPQ